MNIAEAAEEIRSRVDMDTILSLFGLSANRSGYLCCPFHGEKTPSLKLYRPSGWHCFGCSSGRSGIDFVMKMNGQSFPEAVKWINDELELNLLQDRPDPAAKEEAHIREQILDGYVQAEFERIRQEADAIEGEIQLWFPIWLEANALEKIHQTDAVKELIALLNETLRDLAEEKERVLARRKEVMAWKTRQLNRRGPRHASSSRMRSIPISS